MNEMFIVMITVSTLLFGCMTFVHYEYLSSVLFFMSAYLSSCAWFFIHKNK